jgi:hypothetical protein
MSVALSALAGNLFCTAEPFPTTLRPIMTDKLLCPRCACEIPVSEMLAAQIRNQVDQERARLLADAQNQARDAVALQLEDLQTQLAEANTKIHDSQKTELQLRQERRQLEQQREELQLIVSRTLDQERAKIREEAKRLADEDHQLQAAEKDNLVAELRRQIDDLKRKAEQGAPQTQGEIMELQLEDLLRRHFPTDTIEPVSVGVSGGDVLQHVHDATGQHCGTILWEFKRTKNWNDSWLPKLRDDQRAAKAQVAVLASQEMPKGLATFGCIDGVWITSRACTVGLAAALRAGLLEVARFRRSLEGQHTKAESLYNYLSSTEFSQRVEGIVEALVTLRNDLDSEKRSMQRLWAKREKQLYRAMAHTAGFYGDLGGILGPSLPQIAQLELSSIVVCSEAPALETAPWE